MNRRWDGRAGARVVVVADDAVLLLADSDPGVPGSGWWVTPGGGVDDGESPPEAAARELLEETGLPVTPQQLEGPVAHRVAVHGYSDRVLVQNESFFRLRTQRFVPEGIDWSPRERTRLKGFRWWPVERLPDDVWPSELRRLVGWVGPEPLQLGLVDESTVPLSPEERERAESYARALGRRP